MCEGRAEAEAPGPIFSSSQRCFPNFSSLQLPSASVATYIVHFRRHDMWEGARKLKFAGRFFAKIPVSRDVSPNFSFRQLPPDSVSTYIVQFSQHDTWEGGLDAKVPGSIF